MFLKKVVTNFINRKNKLALLVSIDIGYCDPSPQMITVEDLDNTVIRREIPDT